jgi:adenine-specific DNA-methyltransferase
LLKDDGVIWIHIDDKEMAYLKVVCDEVFGRNNFLNMIVVKTSDPSGHKTVNPSPYSQTEYVLMYARNRSSYKYEQRYVESVYDPGYNRLIINRDAPFHEWTVVGLNEHVASILGFDSTRDARKKLGSSGFEARVGQFALENARSVFQPTAISSAAGRQIVAIRDQSASEAGKVFHIPREGYEDVYVLNGRQIYFYSSKVRVIDGELVPAKPLTNLWADIPYNGIAREGGVEFKNGKKPEKLIARCIELTTNRGDLVLDSFAGSGTTGAVAHKMGRRWIMVELGEHCETHIVPRLRKVIDGDDPGGITAAVEWSGGGGFRYYRLAPSLLEKDAWGNWVISKDYDPPKVAQAVCKLMGFVYQPDETHYWMQGRSSETDFIYVTTQSLTRAQLVALSEEVGDERTLLVCCKAFRADPDAFPNLTIRKIPQAVLRKCEWGKDDYSFNVANLPEAPREPEEMDGPKPVPNAGKKRGNSKTAGQNDLFSQGGGK